MRGPVARGLKRLVPAFEDVGPPATRFERPPHHEQFGEALVGARHGLGGRARVELAEEAAPMPVVNRPAVVRVHEAQVPELRALVDVGHTRGGQREQLQGEAVDPARPHQRHDEGFEVGHELRIVHGAGHG